LGHLPPRTTRGRADLSARVRRSHRGLWRGACSVALTLGLLIASSSADARTNCSTSSPGAPIEASTFRPTSASDVPIWKTITLGEYRDVSSLRAAFDNSPCHVRIGVSADEAIGRPTFPFAQSKVELDLVVVSVAELGFPEDGASLEAIYARALSIGLDLCPPDLGPALRLN
jgi:hypothetical protein